MFGYISPKVFLFVCSFFVLVTGQSQKVVPAQNAQLNYISVCFEFPWENEVSTYELQLTNNRTQEQKKYSFKSNKYRVDDLAFGTNYTWQIIGRNGKNNVVFLSEERHFSCVADDKTKAGYIRFKEITNEFSKAGNDLLILDYAKVVINRDQEIIWYLPELPFFTKNTGLRDLKMTQDGTFLAIIDSNAYEMDIDGRVLWKAPNDGKVSKQRTEDYHHDFQKLASGNYMILGNEKKRHLFPGQKDTTRYEIGTIIEYNPKGQVVWEWHASSFLTEELLMLRKKEDGSVNAATHLNAFSIVGNYIYAGFRDASWIIKIDKTSKKVVEIYGGNASGLPQHYGTGLFRLQHDVQVLKNGSIAVVNNDSISDSTVYSSLVVFSQGENGEEKGKRLFSFSFNYDSLSTGKSLKLGNVEELQNGNYLVNMGAINRIFEVTPKGEVVWDVFIDKLDTFKNIWRFFPQYRVAITSSLYPNIFSVKWSPKPLKGKTIAGQMTLFNVGSEKNSYSVFLRDSKGNLKKLKKIPTVDPNESRTFTVTIPEKLIPTTGDIELMIQANGKSCKESLIIKR